MKNNFKTILSLNFDISNKIKKASFHYVLGLLFTMGRKNCSSMSREVDIPRSFLYNFLRTADDNIKSMQQYLFDEAKKLGDEDENAVLVVDFTQLLKPYAYKIDELCYDHNGCTNRREKGLSLGVIALCGKNKTVPLDFDFWVQKKYAAEKYKKKNDIAKELVSEAIKHFKFKYAAFDGAFATEDFLKFLNELGINFTMRIPSNRCIETSDGQRHQIKHTPSLSLFRNEREKSIKACYKGMQFYFIGYKRRGKKDEWETVYLVSNMDLSAKEHVLAYQVRSGVEKMFRTSKQSLGIGECQALSGKKQEAHILATFVAYVFLEQQKIDKQKKCPEDIVHIFRDKNFLFSNNEFVDSFEA